MAGFLSGFEELCALSRIEGRTCESADGPVRILGNSESQDPESQKEYLKLVGDGPIPVRLNDTEKLVRELPRDTEIVALSKESARRMYDCKT